MQLYSDLLNHLCVIMYSLQIRGGDDEATMTFGRTELSELDAESEEDKQHYRVYFSCPRMWIIRLYIYIYIRVLQF